MVKAGAQAWAAEAGIALIFPDTSPRGEDVGDDEAYDLGQGAGFLCERDPRSMDLSFPNVGLYQCGIAICSSPKILTSTCHANPSRAIPWVDTGR